MKSVLKLVILLSASLVMLSGCDQLFALLGFTVSVKGTVTTAGTLMTGTGSITVSGGSKSYSVSFDPPGLDAGNSQTYQFEFPYVPKETYKFVLTYVGNQGYGGSCTVNGQAVSYSETTGPVAGTVTYEVDGVSIQDATTIDLYLGNLG